MAARCSWVVRGLQEATEENPWSSKVGVARRELTVGTEVRRTVSACCIFPHRCHGSLRSVLERCRERNWRLCCSGKGSGFEVFPLEHAPAAWDRATSADHSRCFLTWGWGSPHKFAGRGLEASWQKLPAWISFVSTDEMESRPQHGHAGTAT